MEFPLIYKQRSEPVAIGLSNHEEKDFMKIMIIPELRRIITELKVLLEKDENKRGNNLIHDFLYKIRHIPLFWADFCDELKQVYEEIDKIRDFYQKETKKRK
ncbi:MAG TPA: hypothetical protein VMZ91_00630 [Candidatus Paceibacterota bacterium]|nr:hypothetical protein [Candidatus Paceibacterota bacterium]